MATMNHLGQLYYTFCRVIISRLPILVNYLRQRGFPVTVEELEAILSPATVVRVNKEQFAVDGKSPCGIYIGRQQSQGGWRLSKSIWHNPYSVKQMGNAETAVAMYAQYIAQQPALLAQIGQLHGRYLGCWCKGPPCHGYVLLGLLYR